jgi:hypothetical protein
MDVASTSLVGLALGPPHRQTEDRDRGKDSGGGCYINNLA